MDLWRKNQVVKIRLKRFGTKKRPDYRVVIQDARKPRDGETIEEIGQYHPIAAEGKQVVLNAERVKYWISVGAQPTDIVKKLMNASGLTAKGDPITK
ncbi:MAG: 30S ribosomal protein S16 [Treponema sp.]|jgi:small subunit ribosomal protein S16|nr:30S ribosomal protein S16 [Treponema sp.]MBR6080829.1 30S ribosomal protein S16 [Treponema sp.]MBR6193359.1 30S ribosomal protein S16 [Treponema sp.]